MSREVTKFELNRTPNVSSPRRVPDPRFSLRAHYSAARLPGLACCSLLASGPPRPRIQDRYALFTLIDAEATLWCRGQTQTLSPSSVLLLEPGDVLREIRGTSYSAKIVWIRRELATTLPGASEDPHFGQQLVRCEELKAATTALVEAVQVDNVVAEQQCTTRLFELLTPWWTRGSRRPEPPLIARSRRALAEASAVSLERLATRLGCAPSYLCRVFSDHVGVGPHSYQLQRRLLEASRLLETGRSVTDSAKLTGFGDASHLRRHFLRIFGIPPGEYQRVFAKRFANQRAEAQWASRVGT